MNTKDSDRVKALETKVDNFIGTLTKAFEISRNKLTSAEEDELLRGSIRGKIDTLREKLGGIKMAAQPSYGHSTKQLEIVDNNLDAILDKVCWVYNNPPEVDDDQSG